MTLTHLPKRVEGETTKCRNEHRKNIGMRKEVQPHGGALVRAAPGETANPNGRPRKMVSQILKELAAGGLEPVSPRMVKDTFEAMLGLTLSEILKIAGKGPGDENQYPALMRLVAREMMGKRGMEMLEKMLDRAHGKAVQGVEFGGQSSEGEQTDGVILYIPNASNRKQPRAPEIEDAAE